MKLLKALIYPFALITLAIGLWLAMRDGTYQEEEDIYGI